VSDSDNRVATPSQTVGPFFAFGLTTDTTLSSLVRDPKAPTRSTLRLRVLDGSGAPVPDAMIEIWHSDPEDHRPRSTRPSRAFGRAGTDADGSCTFELLAPQATVGPEGREAAHVNLCIFMRGLMRHLYTRVYFAGDSDLVQDRVLALVPEDRRATLVAQRVDGSTSAWTLDIHLQGAQETVFFDL